MSAASNFLPEPPNNFSTTLNGSISAGALAIVLNDATGIPAEGIGVIYQKNTDNTPVANTIEFIHWTGVSTNTLTLSDASDRGWSGSASGAQAHSSGDTFEVWVHTDYQSGPRTAFLAQHNDDGSLKANAVTTTSITASAVTAAKLESRLQQGWKLIPATLTYASATTVTSSVDLSGTLSKGDKIEFTQTTAKYFYVVSVVGTTITLTGGSDYSVANAAITNPYYSKSASPYGFPTFFNWTPTYSASSSMTWTSVTTYNGRFSLTAKDLAINLYALGTVGGTPSDGLRFTLPPGITTFAPSAGNTMEGGCGVVDNGSRKAGYWYLYDTGVIQCDRYDSASFTAGTCGVGFNEVLEIA